jgi:hypothetical protein
LGKGGERGAQGDGRGGLDGFVLHVGDENISKIIGYYIAPPNLPYGSFSNGNIKGICRCWSRYRPDLVTYLMQAGFGLLIFWFAGNEDMDGVYGSGKKFYIYLMADTSLGQDWVKVEILIKN